jgi:hypothetical protein
MGALSRLDHVAGVIVNANHSVVCAAKVHRVSVPTPFAEKMSTVIGPSPVAASEITLGG